MAIEIKILQRGDENVLANVAPDVFDDPIDAQASVEYLADERHHIVVAIDDGLVIGFVSAVHYIHPDELQPELWINEVGVAATHQQQGIGRALMQAILGVGRALGCTEAWVLTDSANQSAMKLYASAGGTQSADDTVMFSFFIAPR